jgi:hypothetical protein
MGHENDQQATPDNATAPAGPAPLAPAGSEVSAARLLLNGAGARGQRTAAAARAAAVLSAQRTHGNAWVARTLARQAEQETDPSGSLITDVDAFLAQTRAAVLEAATGVLQGTPWADLVDPGIDGWLASHRAADPAELERAIRVDVPGAGSASSADELIDAIVGQVREQIRGRLAQSEVPAGGNTSTSPLLKRDPDSGSSNAADASVVRDRLGGGRPLDPSVRSRMEPALGGSLADVRIHDDAAGSTVARDLGALAFTVGTDVGFARGEYRPGTPLGDALIAHELAHVVQQGDGSPKPDANPSTVALERDADLSAAGAVAALHLGGGLWRSVRPRLRSGLSLRRCTEKSAAVKPAPAREPIPADPKAIYRQKLGEGAEKLKDVSFGRCDTRGSFDDDFWEQVISEDLSESHLALKSGKRASDAIDAMFANPKKWSLDCAQFVQFTEHYALRHALGADEFNRRVGPGLVIKVHNMGLLATSTYVNRDAPDLPWREFPGNKPVSKAADQLLDEAPIGARVMWTNVAAPSSSAFHNENTVKVGPDRFAAQGFAGQKFFSQAELKQKLADVAAPTKPASADYVSKNIFLKQIETFDTPRDLPTSSSK